MTRHSMLMRETVSRPKAESDAAPRDALIFDHGLRVFRIVS
jgi:hypothetical protein